MSFHEIAIAITAEDQASPVFTHVQSQAENTAVSMRTLSMAVATVGTAGSAIIGLASDLGIVDKESAKWARTILSMISVVAVLVRIKYYLATVTGASTTAFITNTAAQTANAGATVANTASKAAYVASTGTATAVTWAFNAALAAKIVLLTLGVGAVIVAAAAMASLAMQTHAAAGALRDYNAVAAETPRYTRSIQRAGEEEELRRRGIEG